MAAGSYTINAEQGATFQLALVWRDSDGEPIDLSGYSARMQVRSDPADEDALISISTDEGGIVLGGEAGTIAIEIDAETMSGIAAPGRYRYDLEIEIDGRVTRLIEGPFTVKPEVTR